MSCGKPPYAPRPDECIYDPVEPQCQHKDCQFFRYELWDLINAEKPLVSIIMPYYNSSKTIRKAVKSIIDQTYPNWELIIVNDGGDDAPEEVYKKLESMDKAVVYRKQKNHGQAHARNKAYTLSSGQFIAYLDPDDEWKENHLEKCLCKILEGYHIVYGNFDYKRFNDDDSSWLVDPHDYRELEDVIGFEKQHLEIGNFIAINTVMHDRRLFVIGGGFEEGVVCGEDGVLWRRMSELGAKFGFVEESTAFYCRYDKAPKTYPRYHQSKVLKMPDKEKGVHLVGKGTNGQELDNQENYMKRVERLKPYMDIKSKKLDYISKA